MLSQGTLLGNRYLLKEHLATGGMGDVWRCTDILLEREVAVKILLPALVSDPEFTIRFRSEARMLAGLRHPGIVAIHDFGEADLNDGSRATYLVMEYIEGEPLLSRIKRIGRLTVGETMSIVTQAAQALHAAHTAGIIHRDVKPGNLLVKPDGVVVLVDFGIARSANMGNITATNTVLGTAFYISPEQAVGQPVSAATDIYALGVVTYYCLAGKPPFTGDNPLQVALAHVQAAPPALPTDVPAPVTAMVARAMAKNPADRYASGAEFVDAARAAQAAAPATPSGDVTVAYPQPATPPAQGQSTPPYGQTTPPYPPSPYVQPTPQPSPPGYPAPTRPAASKTSSRKAILAGLAGVVLVAAASLVLTMNFGAGTDQKRSDQSRLLDQPQAQVSALPSSHGTDNDPTAQATATTTAKPTSVPPTAPTDKPTTTTTPGPAATSGSRTATTAARSAVPNPYTATQVCGSGYQVIDSATLTATNGSRQGRVYLLYNAGNGYNCVVTLKDSSVGTATPVSAYLEVQGITSKSDNGSFEHYAGPVRLAAKGVCVKWGGSAGGVSYRSGFEHCG